MDLWYRGTVTSMKCLFSYSKRGISTWFSRTSDERLFIALDGSLMTLCAVHHLKAGRGIVPYPSNLPVLAQQMLGKIQRPYIPSAWTMLKLARFTLIFSLFLACKASIAGDIVTAIEQAVDCDSCRTLLEVLKGVAVLGDSVFSGALIDVCEVSRVIISRCLSMSLLKLCPY